MVETGKYSWDWWDGDPRYESLLYDDIPDDAISRAYYLRPATKDAVGKEFDGSWGGVCVFLSADGCTLPADKRPRGCLSLEPGLNKQPFLRSSVPVQDVSVPFRYRSKKTSVFGPVRCHGEYDKKQAAIDWIQFFVDKTNYEPPSIADEGAIGHA